MERRDTRFCLMLILIAISVCVGIAGPAFAQVNFLPCMNFQCQPGYKVIQQYDNSCKCVPVDEPQKCDTSFCGPGYRPVLQSNGSCMCVVEDCTNEDGCLKPPVAVEDCPSIEGCDPPRIIKP